MATVDPQPYPGDVVRGYWDIVEISSTGKDFWPLGTDVVGSVELAAGDEFWISSYRTDLLRAGDVLGECNWIFYPTAGSAEIEVSQGIGNWNDWEDPPPWDPPVGVTVAAGARTIVPFIEAGRNFDTLAQPNTSDFYPAVKITVISGAVTCQDLALQIEPPGGLLMVIDSTFSEWLTAGDLHTYAILGYGPSGSSGYNDTSVVAESFVTFTGTFDATTAGAALQTAAGISRSGGNATYSFGSGAAITRSPAFWYSNNQGISRADNTPPFTARVQLYVTYLTTPWPVINPNSHVGSSPPEFLGFEAGRDYVYIEGVGSVEYVTGNTQFTGWGDCHWKWWQVDLYNASLLGVQTGGFSSILGPVPNPANPGFYGLGDYSLGYPPPLGGLVSTYPAGFSGTPPSSGPSPNFDVTSSMLPGSQFTVTVYSASLTGANVPVAGGGPFAPAATWGTSVVDQADSSYPRAPFTYRYPDYRYLIPTFGPDERAVGTVVVVPRGDAGYFRIPDPNLDGMGTGARVSFAST